MIRSSLAITADNRTIYKLVHYRYVIFFGKLWIVSEISTCSFPFCVQFFQVFGIVSNNRDNLLQENEGPKGKMVAVDNEAGQATLEEQVNEVHLAKEDPEDPEEDLEKLLQETRPKWSKT